MLKKVLPIFLRLFDRLMQLGHFVHGKNIFLFSDAGCRRLWGHVPEDPPRFLFGHAGDPDSLESATIKAAWLDECGQNGFRLASYEAILGRLSIHQGRVLLTSRPYTLGWMKQLLWDPRQAAQRNHPQIDIINFRSIDNPAFLREEYYRAKKLMPPWRFSMLYDGLFSRPAGLIYGSFDETRVTGGVTVLSSNLSINARRPSNIENLPGRLRLLGLVLQLDKGLMSAALLCGDYLAGQVSPTHLSISCSSGRSILM